MSHSTHPRHRRSRLHRLASGRRARRPRLPGHRARHPRAAGASIRALAAATRTPRRTTCRATCATGRCSSRWCWPPTAWCTSPRPWASGQSMYQVDRYVDVNTRGTSVLLDILVNAKHHVEKVLVASSIGVYGEGAYRCAAHGPVAPGIRAGGAAGGPRLGAALPAVPGARAPRCRRPEDKALYRDNIYSMTKYHQEEMVLLIGKTYGIPAVAPRFFNVYGPRQSLSNPYAGVAAIWLSRLLNGKPPVVFEDGGQLRDFVSIHDVVDCLVLMLETPGRGLPAGQRRLRRDGDDPRHRPAPEGHPGQRHRAAGHRSRAAPSTSGTTPPTSPRADAAGLRAEGVAGAGVRGAGRVGEDDARRRDRFLREGLRRAAAEGAAGIEVGLDSGSGLRSSHSTSRR